MRTRLLLSALLLLPSALTAQEPDPERLRAEAQAAASEARWADAAAAYARLVEVAPKDANAWHMLGYSLHAEGRLDEAMKAHLQATEFPEVAPVAMYNVACVHALRGETDEAFDWLGKAIEAGFAQASHLQEDSDLESLHDDPRWDALVAKVAESPAAAKVQVFAGPMPRAGHRLFFWSGDGSPGQVALEYGQPTWKDSYADTLAQGDLAGKRWRLGKDFWTTIDSNVDLELGGAKVPAGLWFVVLEAKEDDAFALRLLDPAPIREQKLDAFQADRTEGGIEIPLEHETVEDVAERLEMELVPESGDPQRAELRIRFGPHRLTARATVHVTPKRG